MTAPGHPIELRSDNTAGVHPDILAAVVAADSGTAAAYGADEWSARLTERVRDTFEHPDAVVFPVLTGTAANALALSVLCPPWGAVLCHETSHIIRSECGATSMFGGGSQLRGLPGADHRLDPAALHTAFAATNWGDPHQSQPAVVSLTNPTDFGSIYTPVQLRDIAQTARERGLRVHVDGARLANAIAASGATPADATWRAGVDVLSLGATKNGAMSTDAIVTFDPGLADELTYRVKRAGQVASKMRYQAAQLDAYLDGGRWLRLAEQANAMMQHLATGLAGEGAEFVQQPQANIAYLRVDDRFADALIDTGVLFYRTAPGVIRFVTAWSTSRHDVDEVLDRWRRAAGLVGRP